MWREERELPYTRVSFPYYIFMVHFFIINEPHFFIINEPVSRFIYQSGVLRLCDSFSSHSGLDDLKSNMVKHLVKNVPQLRFSWFFLN